MAESTPLRILVDLCHLWPDGQGGGITPALKGLITWLGNRTNPALEFVFLTRPALQTELTPWLRPADRLVVVNEASSDLAARENCDLVYCPFGMTDWACPGIPTITLIVDLLHRDFPETLGDLECRNREERMQAALKQTDVFQVISDYTGAQLQKHYGVPPGKIVRTYLSIHDRLAPAAAPGDRGDGRPYFFYPANAWAHKNHETLLIAYALYCQAAGAKAWHLVLTGYPDARMDRVREVATTLGLGERVEFLGYVHDTRLASLWDGAGGLVFPSLHEGFGLPLLEAMAREVPIVASNSTAIPEITDNAALLVEGRAATVLAAGMQRLAEDPVLRADLVQRGRQRLKAFSANLEFGRLLAAMRVATAQPARQWRKGYYDVDGLTEPLAIFGLPAALSPIPRKLAYSLRPLGIHRTLEFWCDHRHLSTVSVAAEGPTVGNVLLPAGARTLILRIPDASRLSATDPRTHGVLLGQLQIEHDGAASVDLLGPLTGT